MCENAGEFNHSGKSMKRLFLAAALSGFSLAACGQQPAAAPKAVAQAPASAAAKAAGSNDAAAAANVRAALGKLNGNVQVTYIGASPMPGFREVIASGQLIYVSEDGRYLMEGTVLDLQDGGELSSGSPALAKYRAAQLAQVPKAQRIVFAPPNPKYTISVFTDVECGYCRKLHSQIAEYNKQGIAVEYLAWPRAGLGGENEAEMVSVWCAPDPKQALTDAKSDKPVPQRSCKSPVADEYKLGQRLGIGGTPAIFTADGSQIGGYLPPAQMRAALDQMAAKNN